MTTQIFRSTALALCAASLCTLASAKLPAPSPEAAAKAAEASAKTAWAGKVDGYKLCLSQDRAAAHYRKTTPSATPAAAGLAACTDPGHFAYTPPAAKPAEAAAPAPAAAAPAAPKS